MSGHSDTVTGLSLSPDGTLLLSNAMDNTLRIWDTRAFVEGQVAHSEKSVPWYIYYVKTL